MEGDRVCVICERSLEDQRANALCCSGPCRAERSRLKAILEGQGRGRYMSVKSRLAALENHARGATGGRLRSGPER